VLDAQAEDAAACEEHEREEGKNTVAKQRNQQGTEHVHWAWQASSKLKINAT